MQLKNQGSRLRGREGEAPHAFDMTDTGEGASMRMAEKRLRQRSQKRFFADLGGHFTGFVHILVMRGRTSAITGEVKGDQAMYPTVIR